MSVECSPNVTSNRFTAALEFATKYNEIIRGDTMSNDEQTTIGRGTVRGGAFAIDFTWEIHADRPPNYKPFKNTVELLRYLDDEGYPGAYLESTANDPDHFVVRVGWYTSDTRRQLTRELRGVTTIIYAVIDRIELLNPDDAENRRAVYDVRIMLLQLTESIHNKIRDYQETH